MFAIGITGLARSGKDTVANYLMEKQGFKKFVLSEIVAEKLKAIGKEPTKMNRSLLAEKLRKKLGEDFLAKEAMRRAKELHCKKAVFTGIHSLKEVEYFKKNAEKFFLIAVKAGREKRFKRRTSLDGKTRKEFFARDKHDLKAFDLGKVIQEAEHTIYNNSTINDLRKAINELMEKI